MVRKYFFTLLVSILFLGVFYGNQTFSASLSERINSLKTQKKVATPTPTMSPLEIRNALKNKNENADEKIVEKGDSKVKVTETITDIERGEVVDFFKSDVLNKEIIDILDQGTKKRIEEYQEYIKLQEAEKIQMEADKKARIEQIKKDIEEIEDIVKNQEWIYVGVLYIPKSSALYYVKYKDMVYILPYYKYNISYDEEMDDTKKILDEKDLIMDKLAGEANNNIITITEDEEFKKIQENFMIFSYNDFINKTRVESAQGKTFKLYDSSIVNAAISNIGLTYQFDDGLFVFFIEDEEDSRGEYKRKWDNSLIRIYNNEANMSPTGISAIASNTKKNRELKGFKQFYIPLKMKEETKKIVVKKQNMWLKDVFVIIFNFGAVAVILWFAIKKVLNIYKNY